VATTLSPDRRSPDPLTAFDQHPASGTSAAPRQSRAGISTVCPVFHPSAAGRSPVTRPTRTSRSTWLHWPARRRSPPCQPM
jgi:hypothetical protein